VAKAKKSTTTKKATTKKATTAKKTTVAKKKPTTKVAAKKVTKKSTKKSSSKKPSTKKPSLKKSVASEEVVMDRRRPDVVKETPAVEPVLERRAKVTRRRQIDPTTCERDYNNEEIEFMQALDAYKRSSGRMFPTCSEILEVVRDLGYQKLVLSGTIELVSPVAQAPVVAESVDSELELEAELAGFTA
jgi:hypothetical protein